MGERQKTGRSLGWCDAFVPPRKRLPNPRQRRCHKDRDGGADLRLLGPEARRLGRNHLGGGVECSVAEQAACKSGLATQKQRCYCWRNVPTRY